jgi:hypothetical protein
VSPITRRLQELTEPDALRLLVWSLLTILRAECLLRAASLTTLLRRFGRGPSFAAAHQETTASPGDGSLDQVRRYSNFIATVILRSRRPCLLRCLVLYRYCRRRGVPVSIHFGIRRGTDGLQGHSWLCLHGTPLFEEEEKLQGYANVYTYPETPPEHDLQGGLALAKGLS